MLTSKRIVIGVILVGLVGVGVWQMGRVEEAAPAPAPSTPPEATPAPAESPATGSQPPATAGQSAPAGRVQSSPPPAEPPAAPAQRSQALPPPVSSSFPAAPEEARARCWGNDPNAPVLIEVFSDFQCPHCRTLYLETMRQVLADYAAQGRVCLAYYEFPLSQNPYSRAAARYAVAASRLGAQKWIQVMDALYYYQGQWSQDGRIEPVVAQALSENEFKQVQAWANDPRVEGWIERDVAEGKRRGVGSTPTVFITARGDTQKVTGAVQYGVLRRYIDSLLAQR